MHPNEMKLTMDTQLWLGQVNGKVRYLKMWRRLGALDQINKVRRSNYVCG